jgi:hypothetical protein
VRASALSWARSEAALAFLADEDLSSRAAAGVAAIAANSPAVAMQLVNAVLLICLPPLL